MNKKEPEFTTKAPKPIVVARFEALNQICGALNVSGLPAFVKVELLERILNELRPQIDLEYRQANEYYLAQIGKEENKT